MKNYANRPSTLPSDSSPPSSRPRRRSGNSANVPQRGSCSKRVITRFFRPKWGLQVENGLLCGLFAWGSMIS